MDTPTLRRDLSSRLALLPKVSDTTNKQMSDGLFKALKSALAFKNSNSDAYISTLALLHALAETDATYFHPLLASQNVAPPALLAAIAEAASKAGPVTSKSSEANFEALKRYCIDFTELAAAGKLDPVIGRDSEVRRAIQILSRRSKNNPVLIGEPGVGKTAIAEGECLSANKGAKRGAFWRNEPSKERARSVRNAQKAAKCATSDSKLATSSAFSDE